MPVSFFWKIEQLEIANSKQGLDQAVLNVHWSLTANDGNFSAKTVSNTVLSEPNITNFIPFDSLTEEIVLSWVQNKTDKDVIESIKKNLTVFLAEKTTDKVEIVAPPWTSKQL